MSRLTDGLVPSRSRRARTGSNTRPDRSIQQVVGQHSTQPEISVHSNRLVRSFLAFHLTLGMVVLVESAATSVWFTVPCRQTDSPHRQRLSNKPLEQQDVRQHPNHCGLSEGLTSRWADRHNEILTRSIVNHQGTRLG